MPKEPDTLQYRDIIDLPHPVSKKHPRMSTLSRAAQFAPFAALTGFEGEIKKTAGENQRRLKESEAGVPIWEETGEGEIIYEDEEG